MHVNSSASMLIQKLVGEQTLFFTLSQQKNCKELAEFFLENGADPDILNESGETPLHLALSNRSYQTAEFLVTKEINLCLKDMEENTVLHLAAKLEESKFLELLIGKYQSLDLSIDEENEDGMTALCNAIKSSRGTNVELLLFAGALPNLNFIRGDGYLKFLKLEKYLANVFTLSQKDFCVGSEDSKQILYKFGFNIDWKKRLGEEALHYAVEEGLVYVVKLLITYNFDVNGLNKEGQTPLMLANSIEIFLLLLSAGASQNSEYSDGNTWLHITAKDKSREIVKHALKEDPKLINKPNKLGETALHIAVKNDNANIVELLLNLNADPNIENKEAKTPIDYAIANLNKINLCSEDEFGKMESNSTNNVELLMKHSAKIDLLDDNGILKEELNFFYKSSKLVELLLKEKNFNVHAADAKGLTPLHHAAKCGNLEVLQLLLREGADVNAEDSNGNTSLHYADEGGGHVVSFLIEYSSDINHKNMDGDTPLHFSSQKIEPEISKILLAKRACPDLTNSDGNTPLQLAIIDLYVVNEIGPFSIWKERLHLLEIAQLLIDHSFELNRQNNNGDTALHLAVSKGEFEIVKALIAREAEISLTNKREVNRPSSSISKNASIHRTNKDGNTPLQLTIKEMYRSRCLDGTDISFEIDRLMKIAQLLIDHASKLDRQNNNGDTALHLAVLANELEIVEKLIERREIWLSETLNSSDQAIKSRKRKRSSDF
uniref:Ankyrin-3 n=1 Tax=Culex pipiens TaxID=7175 RepID=A0A8D8K462_CULPI